MDESRDPDSYPRTRSQTKKTLVPYSDSLNPTQSQGSLVPPHSSIRLHTEYEVDYEGVSNRLRTAEEIEGLNLDRPPLEDLPKGLISLKPWLKEQADSAAKLFFALERDEKKWKNTIDCINEGNIPDKLPLDKHLRQLLSESDEETRKTILKTVFKKTLDDAYIKLKEMATKQEDIEETLQARFELKCASAKVNILSIAPDFCNYDLRHIFNILYAQSKLRMQIKMDKDNEAKDDKLRKLAEIKQKKEEEGSQILTMTVDDFNSRMEKKVNEILNRRQGNGRGATQQPASSPAVQNGNNGRGRGRGRGRGSRGRGRGNASNRGKPSN